MDFCILGSVKIVVSLTIPEVELCAEKTEWLQVLNMCPYSERKDINPRRVKGTCKWFTSHLYFRKWEQSDGPSLLWVSADPGCGKSVLARYLIDDKLRNIDSRIICYFFFKDGFNDQKYATTALCCILRQLFKQRYECFSDEILQMLKEDSHTDEEGRRRPPKSFHDLWRLFVAAIDGCASSEIVCVIDALDECEESGRNQLIDALVDFYSSKEDKGRVKFLLTSRPYQNIKARLRDLESEVPTIHLSGEGEEQVAKITCEIDLVIRSRVDGMYRLGPQEKKVLSDELTKVDNRTYLWVHLVLGQMDRTPFLSQGRIRSTAQSLPRTLDEAYDSVLSKCREPELTKKLLHIILAAKQPLTIQDMAVALMIGPDHRSWGDLEKDLVPHKQFSEEIRELCGLFVIEVDKKLYLLHQTAREFLVSSSPSPSSELQWKSTFHPRKSHRILTQACLFRLSLSFFFIADSEIPYCGSHSCINAGIVDLCKCGVEYMECFIAERTFLGYAAQYWPHHFRDCDWENVEGLFETALSYFDIELISSQAWYKICRVLDGDYLSDLGAFIPLCVASHFGLGSVVQRLLNDGASADQHDQGSSAPLHCASANGHDTVVQQLLEAGADINKTTCDDSTALHEAVIHGRIVVVKRLLNAEADINLKNCGGDSPLSLASVGGNVAIVQQLLDAGADVDTSCFDGRTPLYFAFEKGHDVVAQQLIKAQADPDFKTSSGNSILHLACWEGDHGVVEELLDAGADPDAEDRHGLKPLQWAKAFGDDHVIEMLLDAGAEKELEDPTLEVLLRAASCQGSYMAVKRILEAGVDINASNVGGATALHLACGGEGNYGMVVILLEAGADASAVDASGRTPFDYASIRNHNEIMDVLLEAEGNAKAI